MNIIRQPENSNLCGHACVAMVKSLTLDQAIERVGHRGIMGLREIAGAVGSRWIEGEKPTRRSIVLIRREGAQWGHWVVRLGNVFLCPMRGEMARLPEKFSIKGFVPI